MSFKVPSLDNIYEEFRRECNSRHGVTDSTRSLRRKPHQHKDKYQGALIHSSETNCDRIDDKRVISSANGVCSRDNGVRRSITLHIPENSMLQDSSRVVGGVTGVLRPPPGIINTPLHTPLLRSSPAVIANQDKKSYPPPPPPSERRRSATSSSSVTSAPAIIYPLKSHNTPPGGVTQVTHNIASTSSFHGRCTKPNSTHISHPPRDSLKQCKFPPPLRIKNHDIGELATQLLLNVSSLKSHKIPRQVCIDRNNPQELMKKTQVYPPPPKPNESQPTRVKARGRAVNTPLALTSARAHPEVNDSASAAKSKITSQEDNNNCSAIPPDEHANISFPPEAARRNKHIFRKGEVRSLAEDDSKSSVALSNEKSDSVPPEAAADITSAAKSTITNQEDYNNISATHSDERANISVPPEAARRDKLRFRKGRVRRSAKDNNKSSAALSNRKSDSVPPEAAATHSCRDKLGTHLGYRYTLGETLRSPSHATIAGLTPKRASDAIGRSLTDNDCAFVKCSDGSFSYAILACRSEEYDPGNRLLEECMMFVLSNSGQTTTIKKRQWGTCVRLVSKDDGSKDAPIECAKDNGISVEQDRALQQDHKLDSGTLSCDEVLPSTVAFDAEEDDLVSCISVPCTFTNGCPEKAKHENTSSRRAASGAFNRDPGIHFY